MSKINRDAHLEAGAGFAAEVAALRPLLLRLARQRVRNAAWAEDAVSETMVAALERPLVDATPARTVAWVVGILKHKLVDQVRRHTREVQLAGRDDDASELDQLHEAVAERRAPWGDPQASLARRQFIEHVDQCLRDLPQRQSMAFMLRDCMDADAHEVCRELGVSANHLGVLLHRARRSLRAALLSHGPPTTHFA